MGNLFAKKVIAIDIPEEELEELRMTSTFEIKEIARLRLEFLRITKGEEWLSKETFLKIPCIAVNPLKDRICLCFGYPEDVIVETTEGDEDEEKSEKKDEDEDTDNEASFSTRETKEKDSLQKDGTRTLTGSESTEADSLLNILDSEGQSLLSGFRKMEDDDPDEEEKMKNEKLSFRGFLIGISMFNSYGRTEEKLKLAFRIQDFDNDDIISRADMTEYLTRVTGGAKGGTKDDIEDVVEELFHECSSDPRKQKITFLDFQQVVAPSEFQTKLRLPI